MGLSMLMYYVICFCISWYCRNALFSVDVIMMQLASSRTHNTHSLRAPQSVIALDTLLCFSLCLVLSVVV